MIVCRELKLTENCDGDELAGDVSNPAVPLLRARKKSGEPRPDSIKLN